MSDDRPTPTADLVAALGSLENPARDSKANAGARSWQYLSLAELLAAVRPVLAAHRIAIMQEAARTDEGVAVETILLHADETVWRSPPFVMPADRSPHGLKSAVTYARRLSLETMLGIAGGDDDGQAVQAELTRPERVRPKASDPDPWQTAPPQRPPQLPARPVPPQSQPDAGAPSTRTLASGKQTKYLWTLLRQSGMTDAEVRPWVQAVLSLDSPDWHTTELTSAQVSQLIERLKADTPPDEEPAP